MSAAPGLSYMSSSIAVKLDDQTDLFDDAFIFPNQNVPTLQPRDAELKKAKIVVPHEASTEYRWLPFPGRRHIRLVTLTSLDGTKLLSRLDLDSNSSNKEYEILTTSSPGQSFMASIQQVDLDSPTRPHYAAISYTWLAFPRDIPLLISDSPGEAAKSSESSLVASLPINASLHSFLQRLMTTSNGELRSLTLWIDQICIDQTNDIEKGEQVRLMKDIFARADKTYIWLGESDDDSNIAINALKLITPLELNLYQPENAESIAQEKATAAAMVKKAELRDKKGEAYNRRTAIARLLNRPYFERAWIYQEAAVSRHATVKIGNVELDFAKFNRAVAIYSEAEQDVQRNFGASLDRVTKGVGTLSLIEFGRRKLESMSAFVQDANLLHRGWSNLEFMNLISQLAGAVKAKDDRDFIFAFLGFQDLTRDPPLLVPDYVSNTTTVYHRVTASLIKDTHSLDPIALAGEHKDRLEGLPTWCPDYRLRLPQGQPFAMPGASCGFNASAGYQHTAVQPTDPNQHLLLMVRGRTVDTVAAVDPQGFSLEDRNKGGVNTYLGISKHADFLPTELEPGKLVFDGFANILSGFQQKQHQEHGPSDTTVKRLLRVLLADGAFARPSTSFGSHQEPDFQATHVPGDALTEAKLSRYQTVLKKEDAIRHQNAYLPDLEQLTAARAEIREKMLICFRKRLFVTEGKKLGLAPETVEVGDAVAILHGSRLPVLLRPNGEGLGTRKRGVIWWRVVGCCYLEDWMDGRLVHWMEEDGDEMVLC